MDGAEPLRETDPIWMVNRVTGMDGLEGTLTLETEAIVFTPTGAEREPFRFPLSEVRRAHRVLGSPVLEVAFSRGAPVPVTGFYFVKPLRISGRDPSSGRSLETRRRRRASAIHLSQWNASLKQEIREWAGEIRDAVKALNAQGSPGADA